MLATSLLLLASAAGALVGANSCPANPRCAKAGSGLTPHASFARVVDLIYNVRDVTQIRPYFNTDYIQHDADVPDGVDATIQQLLALNFGGGGFAFQSIIPPCNGNDKGMIHYKYTFPGGGGSAPLSSIDVLRFEGSCVAEHWNVNTPVPSNATSKHPLLADNLAAKAIVPSCSGD